MSQASSLTADTKAIEEETWQAQALQDSLEQELAEIAKQIDSELDSYKLVQNFKCIDDTSSYGLKDGKNNLINVESAVDLDLVVDFNGSIQPLIKEKKERQIVDLDSICQEREEISHDILLAQQELKQTLAQGEELRDKSGVVVRDVKGKELLDLEQKNAELELQVQDNQKELSKAVSAIDKLEQEVREYTFAKQEA